jgi:gas vesicle protein
MDDPMDDDAEDRTSSGVLPWLFVGAVAGAAVALLLAPTSGRRTRERLQRGWRRTRRSVSALRDDLAERASHIVDAAGDMADKASAIAAEASAVSHEAMGRVERLTRRSTTR